MSRKIIQDIVIPIVSRLMSTYGVYPHHHLDVRDEALEEFLEEELQAYFNPYGKAGECEELERLLKEAKQRDETQFELLIERLVNKYVKLRSSLTKRKRKKEYTGPPDRFLEQLKKAEEVWKVAQ